MQRGRKALTFLLSLSLTMMLYLPGQSAWAEQAMDELNAEGVSQGSETAFEVASDLNGEDLAADEKDSEGEEELASEGPTESDDAARGEEEPADAGDESDQDDVKSEDSQSDETYEQPEGDATDGEAVPDATDGEDGSDTPDDISEATDDVEDNKESDSTGESESDATENEAASKEDSSDNSDEASGDEEGDSVEEDATEETEDDEPIVHVEAETPENDGDIALRVQAARSWVRIAGDNAYGTMQKILQTEGVFADKRGGTVIVATGDGYWDALSATGLAGTLDAPVIITPKSRLAPQAKQELKRLQPKTVYVMGGSQAITNATVDQIKKALPKASVSRIYGAKAADTSVAAYKKGKGWGSTAIVATNSGYWDALSIAPYAYAYKAPVFLTSSVDSISSSVINSIKSGGFTKVVIVGGNRAVSSSVEQNIRATGVRVERIGGKDAIETSGMIAKWERKQGMELTHLAVATSDGYWDALSGASLCGKQNSVLVLVSKNGDYRALDAIYNYGGSAVEHGHILGGPSAIPKSASSRISAEWTLKSISLSTGYARKGTQITAVANGSGVPEGTTYAWSWQRRSDGQTSVLNTTKTNTKKITFNTAGAYIITCKATASNGKSSTMTRAAYIYELRSLRLSNSGNKYVLTADMNVPTHTFSGVQYRFTWNRVGASGGGVLQNWSNNPSTTFTSNQFGAGSKIQFTVEARDASGSLGTKTNYYTPDPMTIKAQGYSSPTNYLVMVDDTNCWVGIYTGYQGNWSRVQYFRCSTGNYNATPKGIFSIGGRGYSFSGDGHTCYWYTDYHLGLYAFHSVLYHAGTYNIMDGRLGVHISAGCVRLDIKNAKWIYDNVPYATTVVIYN